jgi:hypothetical protein
MRCCGIFNITGKVIFAGGCILFITLWTLLESEILQSIMRWGNMEGAWSNYQLAHTRGAKYIRLFIHYGVLLGLSTPLLVMFYKVNGGFHRTHKPRKDLRIRALWGENKQKMGTKQ